MSLDAHGARLTRRDIAELATASDQLAVAADTIRRMRPAWGEAVVNLLIAANVAVVRVQNKGAARFARYLQKHGLEKAQDASEGPAAGDNTAQGDNVPPEGAEG